MAIFVPRFVRQLRDVLLTAPADGEVLTYDSADAKWKNEAGGGGGGLTFAQILTALAAIGVTIDPTDGAILTESTAQDRALLRIKQPAGYFDTGYYQPFEIVDENDFVVWTFSSGGDMDATMPPGSGAGSGWSLLSTDLPNNRFDINLGTWNFRKEATAQAFLWFRTVDAGGVPTGDQFIVDERLRLEMGNISGAPADGDIDDGHFHLWPDATNGAAMWRGKGKTLDGTVVTWEIPNGVYTPGASGAPSTATYITQTPDAGLSAEQALSALATGLVKNTTGTGVLSIGAQGTDYWAPGGTDVAVADGGTGSSTAGGALTNFGVSAFIQTLLDDADAVTARATLGVLAALFQDGGAQEISVTGLAGLLADAQKITVRKNTGADVGTRKRVNFIEGTNVTLTVADDAGGDEVDVTIASSGGGGATALDGLTDAAVASPVAGQGLAYDGTDFVNIRQPQLVDAFTPAGGLAQTCSRVAAASTITLVSLRLDLYGIWLPKGLLITSITFLSQATALSVGINQLFGIFDDNSGSSSGTARALLRGSVDGTSGAWAANAFKTLALTSTYTTTRAGLHYLGVLVNATTPPNLDAVAIGTTAIAGLTPIVGGTSTTTITALPNPAGAISANGRLAHAYVS